MLVSLSFKQAMNDYTNRDKGNFGDTNIAKQLAPSQEKLEVCQDMFFGLDYTAFKDENATNLMRANVTIGGVNFITSRDKDKESFLREATLLKQAPAALSFLTNARGTL